ncbi:MULTISPECIES: hypothetical protein [unclassified Nocardioides]|uniref:hypothetical protein n=1 Tax=unclassified Nocardioides TaxID=2615069 RepID=UPI000056F794|nr:MULTISPECIES: hypothetical protein [unclassified Nocardioides]ABL79546.1 hypothetical protein Noca_4967 [Nocardioides sp. JS614]
MVPNSPADALGSDAPGLRDLLVEIVRARHALAAEAHLVSESRYAMGFGSQWRDLLDDARDALKDRGFRFCKLAPGGHEIPVVNDCLVYVWRVPNNPSAVSEFASSPTRKNGFTTSPLDPALWEPRLSEEQEPAQDTTNEDEVGPVLRAVGESMSLVLVMVESTPRQLQSIDWAVAVLDDEGKVELRGHESIWEPEPVADANASGVEPFDSGSPVEPKVEAREEEGSGPDA